MNESEKIIEEPVVVLFHLNGGFTKVFLERTKGFGMANFRIDWDIPTEIIPIHLRNINSRFLLREEKGETEIIEIE